MASKTYQVESITCPVCASKIETAVKRIHGVKKVEVLFNASKVKVDYADGLAGEKEVKKTIENLGFDVTGEK